jgi:Zn-dependent peptidase ImmA (M78 family)
VRRFLDAVDYAPTIELPSLGVDHYGSPERIAGVVRAHWAVPTGPLKGLTALVERSGVIVGTSDFSGASISGMTFRVPGQPPLVLLNRNHPADRMRFTLAHELGHLVMHRFPSAEMEDEANAFASALLMPEREMREAFADRSITLELLAALKPEWRVAMQSLLMRAKALGYLSDNQNRYLWQQISARGWRTREPSELDFPHEWPTVLDAIIKAHLADLGFTMSDLSRLVPMHESEFVKMYDLAEEPSPKARLRLVV